MPDGVQPETVRDGAQRRQGERGPGHDQTGTGPREQKNTNTAGQIRQEGQSMKQINLTDDETEIILQCLDAYIKTMQKLENTEKEEKGRQLLEQVQNTPEGQTGPTEKKNKTVEIRRPAGPEGYNQLSKAGQTIIFKALAVLLQENYSFETIYNLLRAGDKQLIDSMIANPELWQIEAQLRQQGIEEQAAEIIRQGPEVKTQWRPEDLPF